MIDYSTHELILTAAGLSEETFKAQRTLMIATRKELIRELKYIIDKVPESELKQGPAYIKGKLYDLLNEVQK